MKSANLYLSQCISGLEAIIVKQLETDLRGFQDLLVEPGLIVFRCEAREGEVRKLKYLSNSFLILKWRSNVPSIETFIADIVHSWNSVKRPRSDPSKRESTFRVMFGDAGKLVAVDQRLRSKLELRIASSSGLKLKREGATVEYWGLRRRSGESFFAIRITRRLRTEKNLHRGELRPELAKILCLLSKPSESDVFLDPFAGTGAIPIERARTSYRKIFATDVDAAKVTGIKSRYLTERENLAKKGRDLFIAQADATKLGFLGDSSIDKIVCDPPWGIYMSENYSDDLFRLYSASLNEFVRVTKAGGTIIALLGRGAFSTQLMHDFRNRLELVEQHDLLVAGKKATIFCWRRCSESTHR